MINVRVSLVDINSTQDLQCVYLSIKNSCVCIFVQHGSKYKMKTVMVKIPLVVPEVGEVTYDQNCQCSVFLQSWQP